LEEAVEFNFESEKKAATTNIIFSSNFELNQIAQLQAQTSDSSLTFSKKSRNFGLDECNTFLTHERNKHLFVLQTAKRLRDIMKHQQLEPKSGCILLLTLTLCKRAILMAEFILKNLKSRIPFASINEDGYQDFFGSPICEKYTNGVTDDLKQAQGFYVSLEAKLKEPWVRNLDQKVEADVRDSKATEGHLYSTTDRLLVHLFIWEKENSANLPSDLRRQLLLGLIGTHYCLNLNVEFPCWKNSEVFNWKQFFDNMESISETDAARIKRQYSARTDEIGTPV
jgi:hypothetical protein